MIDEEGLPVTQFACFSEIVDRALSRGLSIHPVRPRDKAPWLNGWPKLATNDPKVISEWKTRFPNSNYGVAANEEFCILESDDFATLTSRLSRSLPPTYTVQARPNRPHLYFRQTGGSKAVGNMDVPGVFEFKQNNRYVVGEGSIHPSGAVYECISSAPIAEIPDWLVQDLQALRNGKAICAIDQGRKLGEGEGRHPFLVSQAGLLWDGQKTREQLLDELQACNEQNCDPPRTIDHVTEIVDWVMQQAPHVAPPKVEMSSPWGKTVGDLVAWYHEQTPRTPLLTQLPKDSTDEQPVFYSGSINQIFSWRGLGKTNFALGLANCFATGRDFLNFKATNPRRVVYVDGELPILQLCERAERLGLDKENILFINPEIITPRGQINLLKPSHFARLRQAIEVFKGDVVILDSQSTLMSGDSLDLRFQESRMEVLRTLRWDDKCVIEMHHAGKGNLQRGSSRNDDILDVQIELRRTEGWIPGEGLSFDLYWEKVRHAAHLEGEFTVKIEDGKWIYKSSDIETAVIEDLKKGLSCAKIAKEMDLSPSSVKRIRVKALRNGLLELNSKTEARKK